MNGSRVDIDTSKLERDMRRLAAGLDTAATAGAQRQATQTAGAIRSGVPRRSGRLAGTVKAAPDGDGWAVTYGGGLPYARYIEHRAHAVEHGLTGADTMFVTAMRAAVATEVGRI